MNISLKQMTSGYNLSMMNSNFTMLQNAYNNTTPWLVGGNNTWQQDIDLNSNDLLNANTISTDVLVLGGTTVVPTNLGAFSPNSVGTIQLVDGSVTNSKVASGIDPTKISFIQNGAGAVTRTIRDKLLEIEVSLYDFGYVDGMADATAIIQRAIDSLPARGGRVRLPPGTINVTGLPRIGNGNGGATPSSKNGVKIVGAGAGFAVSGGLVPTILNYTGLLTTNPMLAINGQASDCEISGIFFACNGLCGGISLTSVSGTKISNVKIVNPSQGASAIALFGGTAPTGNYNTFNTFESINIALLSPSSIGILCDGNYAFQNDTWISTFSRVRVETVSGATNAVCAWFKFIDSCTFTRCHFDSQPEATSLGVVIDATANDGFPAGMAFYDCSIYNHAVYENGTNHIRKNYFYGFGTYDNETIPTHPSLCGITDTGVVFGDFVYNEAWKTFTPTVTLVGGTGNVVPTYVTNIGRYKKIGKTVQFEVLLDGNGGTAGAGTGQINIALPVPCATSVYSEHHGRVVDNTTTSIGYARVAGGASTTTMDIRYFGTGTSGPFLGSQQATAVRTIAVRGTYESAS